MSLSLSSALLVLHLAGPAEACVADDAVGPRPSEATVGSAAAPDSTLVALYESGETFADFLAAANARRALWVRNWEEGKVPADVLAQARAIPGRWRLLVVALAACSDSVNTIPFIALLVAAVPTFEMRIITPEAGRRLMSTRRTPDGRAATPTVIILAADGSDAGCWIERPAVLQDLAQAERASGTMDAWPRKKQEWYDADAGASTIREIVTGVAAAASGIPRCGSPPATTPSATID
jgi:hypothetical protein